MPEQAPYPSGLHLTVRYRGALFPGSVNARSAEVALVHSPELCIILDHAHSGISCGDLVRQNSRELFAEELLKNIR